MKGSSLLRVILASIVVFSTQLAAQDAPANRQSLRAAILSGAASARADSGTALLLAPAAVTLAGEASVGAPVASGSGVGVARSLSVASFGAAQDSLSGIKGFLFGTRRRTSNTLLIGGAAFAAIGVGVVKGHAGAIMGVAGLCGTVGGLYLAF